MSIERTVAAAKKSAETSKDEEAGIKDLLSIRSTLIQAGFSGRQLQEIFNKEGGFEKLRSLAKRQHTNKGSSKTQLKALLPREKHKPVEKKNTTPATLNNKRTIDDAKLSNNQGSRTKRKQGELADTNLISQDTNPPFSSPLTTAINDVSSTEKRKRRKATDANLTSQDANALPQLIDYDSDSLSPILGRESSFAHANDLHLPLDMSHISQNGGVDEHSPNSLQQPLNLERKSSLAQFFDNEDMNHSYYTNAVSGANHSHLHLDMSHMLQSGNVDDYSSNSLPRPPNLWRESSLTRSRNSMESEGMVQNEPKASTVSPSPRTAMGFFKFNECRISSQSGTSGLESPKNPSSQFESNLILPNVFSSFNFS